MSVAKGLLLLGQVLESKPRTSGMMQCSEPCSERGVILSRTHTLCLYGIYMSIVKIISQ